MNRGGGMAQKRDNSALEAVLVATGTEREVDLTAYARQDRRFQYLLERGIEPGPWIAIERDLVQRSQIPSGKQRQDLSEELSAASERPEIDQLFRAVLSSSVDVASLEDLGIEVVEHDDEHTVAVICVEGARTWPDALGGTGVVGEIERRFTIHARRAPWRDRAVRRLAKLEIVAVEVHPDPEQSA